MDLDLLHTPPPSIGLADVERMRETVAARQSVRRRRRLRRRAVGGAALAALLVAAVAYGATDRGEREQNVVAGGAVGFPCGEPAPPAASVGLRTELVMADAPALIESEEEAGYLLVENTTSAPVTIASPQRTSAHTTVGDQVASRHGASRIVDAMSSSLLVLPGSTVQVPVSWALEPCDPSAAAEPDGARAVFGASSQGTGELVASEPVRLVDELDDLPTPDDDIDVVLSDGGPSRGSVEDGYLCGDPIAEAAASSVAATLDVEDTSLAARQRSAIVAGTVTVRNESGSTITIAQPDRIGLYSITNDQVATMLGGIDRVSTDAAPVDIAPGASETFDVRWAQWSCETHLSPGVDSPVATASPARARAVLIAIIDGTTRLLITDPVQGQ
jgi:hypothetical protein